MSTPLPPDDEPRRNTPAAGDAWQALRRHTAARIALGRSGVSVPTREHLAFGVAHAQARDAVHAVLAVEPLREALIPLGLPVLAVTSHAPDRAAYLARPDWGRALAPAARQRLEAVRAEGVSAGEPDAVIVIADGLSASGVQQHVPALLAELLPRLAGLHLAPLVIATQARVALADEIGEALGARLALCLIGERPGWSSADSVGAYVTLGPRRGRSDAERNCVSNLRPAGLGLAEGARQTAALVRAALDAGRSGVALRFDPDAPARLPPR